MANICTILEQRRQLALLRKPAIRYEGSFTNNPYANGYTKEQLDMRRKTEILQYKKSSSQITDQMTRKGRYAKLFTIAGNNNICPADLYLPSLTSSSNVPGPITTLQYDKDIPLYNYATGEDNYANLTPNINSAFELYSENNVLVPNDSTVTVASILINNPSNTTSSFTINIPIGIYISAEVSGSNIYDASFYIPEVTFGVYYTGKLVPETYKSSNAFSNKFVRVISNNSNAIFSGTLYLGSFTTTITLPTQKGFLYEFRMSATTDLMSQTESNYTNRRFSMFANISNLSPINCSIVLSSGGPLNPVTNPGKITIT
jgi:hypothetical protein